MKKQFLSLIFIVGLSPVVAQDSYDEYPAQTPDTVSEEPTSVPIEEPTSVPIEEPTSVPIEEPASTPILESDTPESAPPIQELDRMIVVGYGSVKEKNLSSSVGSANTEMLTRSTTARLDQALQGQVAGVSVTSAGNAPGADVIINIRGISSTSLDDQPLFVIDGVWTDAKSVSRMNPSDIESVQILRDASTAAIYGAKAGNGVVLITTKKGVAGPPRIAVNTEIGFQIPAKLYDMMSTAEHVEYMKRFYTMKDANGADSALDTAQLLWAFDTLTNQWRTDLPNTDWQAEMYSPALTQHHDFRIEGGGENAKVLFSGGYLKQDGILLNTWNKRTNLRLNSTFVKNRLTISEALQLSNTERRETNQDGSAVDIAKVPPQMPVKDTANSQGWGYPDNVTVGAANHPNPVALANQQKIIGKNYAALASMHTTVAMFEGLNLHFDLNMSGDFDIASTYYENIDQGPSYVTGPGRVNEAQRINRSVRPEPYLDFQRDFGQHDLSVVAGASWDAWESRLLYGGGGELYSGTYTLDGVIDKSKVVVSGDKNTGTGVSMFGRVNYSYASMIIAGFSLRRDGSSAFSSENRWGTFPGVSLAFNAAQLPALQNNTLISAAKLRAAYGTTGRSGGSSWSTLNNTIDYSIDGATVPGVAPTAFATPDLKWETVHQIDVGLDAGFFESAVNVNADYFVNTSTDMLVEVTVPGYTGITARMFKNLGSVSNNGFDATVRALKSTDMFDVNAAVNLSIVRNEVIDIDSGEIYGNGTITKEGEPIGMFYGYKAIGVFQSQTEIDGAPTQSGARPGDMRFADVDGDGEITTKDRTTIGNPWPKMSMGLNLGGQFRGLDFTLGFAGVFGNDILNLSRRDLTTTHENGAWSNHLTEVNDSWTGPGTSNDVPMMSSLNPNDNYRISSRYVENGSYVRLNLLQIGYSVKEDICQKLGMEKLRLYVTASNLFTITGYSGLDPDITAASVLSRGVDSQDASYPRARTFAVGAQLSF